MEVLYNKQLLDRYKIFIMRYCKSLNIQYNPLNHTVKKLDDIQTIINLADRAAELEFSKVLNNKINDDINANKLLR